MINISADKHSATSEQTPAPEMALVYVGLRFTKTTSCFGRQPGAYSDWNTGPSEPWQPYPQISVTLKAQETTKFTVGLYHTRWLMLAAFADDVHF